MDDCAWRSSGGVLGGVAVVGPGQEISRGERKDKTENRGALCLRQKQATVGGGGGGLAAFTKSFQGAFCAARGSTCFVALIISKQQ